MFILFLHWFPDGKIGVPAQAKVAQHVSQKNAMPIKTVVPARWGHYLCPGVGMSSNWTAMLNGLSGSDCWIWEISDHVWRLWDWTDISSSQVLTAEEQALGLPQPTGIGQRPWPMLSEGSQEAPSSTSSSITALPNLGASQAPVCTPDAVMQVGLFKDPPRKY